MTELKTNINEYHVTILIDKTNTAKEQATDMQIKLIKSLVDDYSELPRIDLFSYVSVKQANELIKLLNQKYTVSFKSNMTDKEALKIASDRFDEVYNEIVLKEKYSKDLEALLLSKFPKKNGTINIEAAAKTLNTSKHNLYKILQRGKYKGSNYNIDLLQSIFDKLSKL